MSLQEVLKETFGSMTEEYYPGSKRRRRESREMRRDRQAREKAETKANESWDAHPRKVYVQGVEYEMFPIGALAKALERSPVTIRTWIRDGWLPNARYKTRPIEGTRGNAGRRLWTRKQITEMRRLAAEEGLLGDKSTQIQRTWFRQRVFSEYRSWT